MTLGLGYFAAISTKVLRNDDVANCRKEVFNSSLQSRLAET